MRYLIAMALSMGLFATGCATTQTPQSSAAPPWLEMKDGYAQSCIADGGCVPMSQRELRELVNTVATRALQMCARSGT